jgi:omega-amidase
MAFFSHYNSTTMKMRLALAQMHISPGNLPRNMQNAGQFILNAAPNADLVLLPELWSSGYDLSQAAHWTEANQEAADEISSLAREHQIWIGGSLLEARAGNIYNTFTLTDPHGNRHAAYDKIHLFKLMHEDKYLTAGEYPVITDLPCGKTGLTTCYDLRFPELFRQYAFAGARLILLSAEWPLVRIEHWTTLLRARAIENQLFIAAVNAVGISGNTHMGGSSMFIDPWGNIIAEGSPDTENLLTAELDFDLVAQVRMTIPALVDRRLDIY